MRKRRRWSDRARLLVTLELALVLPAAALIAFSIYNLKSIQRDKAVEAAIQRDFTLTLNSAEKSLNRRVMKMVSAVREEFPCPTDPVAEKLDQILDNHPELAHVFLYDKEKGIVVRSQPRRMDEPHFRAESEDFANTIRWVKLETKELFQKLRRIGEKDGYPLYFYTNWVPRGEKQGYQVFALMTLPKWPADHLALGGVAFDSEFLRDQFFPEMLNSLLAAELTDQQPGKNGGDPVVMMVHVKKEPEPLATSAGWDGGQPEVEKNLEGVFQYLTLAIKFKGTTIKELSRRFMRNSFLIVGGLSLLLAAGIWLTYRNVAREMALAKLKSDFVANVSHELRTPLALIRLYAETLEMGRLNNQEKYQEYYRIIRKESERLSALINNILDFSRIEAGRKEYDFRETNLAELVRSTMDAYRYQIEQQGFAYQENIRDDLPPLRVDREAIARSLLNLVNNAIKYSQNERFLGVNLYRDNGAVKLEVIDHGIGIPRTEQTKIFEKFYRVGDPLVHNTKGSGLGLSLVRHIVQAHGGEVSVESAPGRGSKFIITLPMDQGANKTAAA